jgi:hypothetical protein
MVKSVEDEPVVRLTHWGIMQDVFGYRLVGVPEGRTPGRVTSPVVSWDSHALVATTESGRQYHLVGDADRDVAVAIIKVHAAKYGVPGDQVALADVWELEMLGPQPGEGVH